MPTDKEINSFYRKISIVAIVYLLVFVFSVLLYYSSTYINNIVLFLLVFYCFAIFYSYDFYSERKIYIKVFFISVLLTVLSLVFIRLSFYEESREVLVLSFFSIVFLIVYKLLYNIYYFLFKAKPKPIYEIDKKDYKNSVFVMVLFFASLLASFSISDCFVVLL